MGRIRQSIAINGRPSWTLFDSEARNTYITLEAATGLSTTELPRPTHTRLGGETKSSSRAALLVGEIEGRPFHTEAMVIDRIGKNEEGKAIGVLFGAPGACPAYGDRSEEVRNCDHFFAKFEDNSELFDENLRKTGVNLSLSQPIHPKPDRLLTMQQWGINLLLEPERLDLSHYPTELPEF